MITLRHRALVLLVCTLVSAGAWGQSLRLSGVFEASDARALALSASGVVALVEVAVGDTVSRGDQLLVLQRESEVLELERRQLVLNDRSDVTALERQTAIRVEQFDALERLHAEGRSISREHVLQAELERVQARAALDQVLAREQREELEYRIARQAWTERALVAPIDGVVARVHAREGEWLATGATAVDLVALDVLVLKVYLPATQLERVELGRAYPVRVDGQRPLSAELIKLAPVADPATGLVEATLELDNVGLSLRPGMQAEVRFEDGL